MGRCRRLALGGGGLVRRENKCCACPISSHACVEVSRRGSDGTPPQSDPVNLYLRTACNGSLSGWPARENYPALPLSGFTAQRKHILSVLLARPLASRMLAPSHSMSAHQDYRDSGPPAKRSRQDDLTDDGGRPYSLAGPSVHPEADASLDASSKRNRKRPLSCGECRRCAYTTHIVLSGLGSACISTNDRLKLKVSRAAISSSHCRPN